MGAPLEGTNDFVGRQDPKFEWLYDIVSNRHTGLDADKIDYFARDEGRAIDKCGLEMKMITDARVAKARCSRPAKCHTCRNKFEPGFHYMICYPEKHVAAAANFFKKRFHLHDIVYQHKTTAAVESMICDIFCHADPYLRLQSYSGERFPISRACFKSDFYLRLDDTVLTLIAHSTDERLKEAQDLLRRFKRHDFYKCAVDLSLDIDRSDVDVKATVSNCKSLQTVEVSHSRSVACVSGTNSYCVGSSQIVKLAHCRSAVIVCALVIN